MRTTAYFFGLDLGQVTDRSARPFSNSRAGPLLRACRPTQTRLAVELLRS